MAATTADPSALTSSAQVFTSGHTLPQIRAIHKSLHAQVDDKAARLRTRVGASYRELLGTADAIVRMRGDMEAVQATLGRMGARCGRGVVGGKVAGLARFVRERDGEDDDDEEDEEEGEGHRGSGGMGPVARAKLLDACVLAGARVLRPGAAGKGTAAATTTDKAGREAAAEGERPQGRGDRLVVAAKVLVLSRLLIKSLEGDRLDPGTRAAVEALRRRRDALVRRHQRGVERALQAVSGEAPDREGVLKALCAHSLATGSGARDVVRYFLRVRGESMAMAFEADEPQQPQHDRERAGGSRDVVRGLALYTRTLLDVQALVPARLTEALRGLKRDRLLADEALRGIEGLRLDIYERWCGDEIRFYTPYLRHDDLDAAEARETLAGWAAKGGEVLLRGLEAALRRTTEFGAIVDTRTQVLRMWIRDGAKARGLDPSAMLDRLRAAVNARTVEVLGQKVGKLRLVGSEVAASLASWREGVTDRHRGLWDQDGLDVDLAGGAGPFGQDVVARLYGRSDAVSKAVASYKSWHRVVDDVGQTVEQLRRQRWDNDADEVEDEETLEARQRLLSKEDPQALHDHLDAAMAAAFADLDAQLAALWRQHGGSPDGGRIAMYLLRVLRDIRSRLPKLPAVEGFGAAMVPALQDRVAAAVALAPLDEFATSALARRRVVGRSLWEGEPALPTSPSPGLFRLLRDLSLSMGGAGMDLWSPAAVSVLKRHLGAQIGQLWSEALAAVDEKEEGEDGEAEEAGGGAEAEDEQARNDAAAASATAEQTRDLFIQWLFDVSMLRACLDDAQEGKPADEVGKLEDDVYRRTGLDSEVVRQRLAKASQDYWKRTSLLFGLLA